MRFNTLSLLVLLGSAYLVNTTTINLLREDGRLLPLGEPGKKSGSEPAPEKLNKETCEQIAKSLGEPKLLHGLKVICQGQKIQIIRGKAVLLATPDLLPKDLFKDGCQRLQKCAQILGIEVENEKKE
ncbi:hypothetical protein K7432_004786 [Basidiobolus ranarum]|uniref:Uncharacterized protein n=1 Tax=Basidiobolus ranarum TaxID=34480 RepID=A0ABR2WXM9_9FUNG